VRLASWLASSGAAQSVFAGLFSPPVQQSLVSKWRRGITIPNPRMRRAIEMVTGGAVTWEPSDRRTIP
jgi:DNA-binding transcriptional regulator YdaS (Cro superfamily)